PRRSRTRSCRRRVGGTARRAGTSPPSGTGRRRTVPPSGGSGNSVARWRTVRACVCRGHCSRLPLLYRAPRVRATVLCWARDERTTVLCWARDERATVLCWARDERATVRWPVSGFVAGVERRPDGVSRWFGSEPGVEDRVE